ncbi:DUF1559 family PulG-like putative transporter [Bremerella alba]|uniref:DUF1559 domain-containing protein n=1 Tax=Bremerella alba TaxID=980252 RepID=A0A7V8V5I7_9BACT|nr:DUF1559 domain-containing protein [Bremerella alba]MBA2115354.1 hypothetical protein [Bremerella alba]
MMVVESSATADSSTQLNCGGTVCDFKGGLWIGGRHQGNSVGWHPGVLATDVFTYGGGNSTYLIGRSNQAWGDDWTNSSTHPGGIMTVLSDASVRFIPENINVNKYKWLRARADGQVIGEY